MVDIVIFINTSDQNDSQHSFNHGFTWNSRMGTSALASLKWRVKPHHGHFFGFLVCKTELEKWGVGQSTEVSEIPMISHGKPGPNMVGGLGRQPRACFYDSKTTVHVTFLFPVSIVVHQTAQEIELWGLRFMTILS